MDTGKVGFEGGFTVLMSVYKAENPVCFDRALQSIFSNSLKPDEVILIADGPLTLSLEAVLSKYLKEQKSLKVLRLPSNKGLARALNFGLEHVKTKWIVRADSDDRNRLDRFAEQAAAITLRLNKIDVLGGAIQEIDIDGTPLAIRKTAYGQDKIRLFAKSRSPFNHMTVCYRADMVRLAGGYPYIPLKEDYALWASLLYLGARCENIPNILVDAVTGKQMYRRRGGLAYALAEISLQKHLIKCRIKTIPRAILDGFARASVFLLPIPVRAYLYGRLLRAPITRSTEEPPTIY